MKKAALGAAFLYPGAGREGIDFFGGMCYNNRVCRAERGFRAGAGAPALNLNIIW